MKRARNRRKYVSPYVVVLPETPFALVDPKDGHLLAFGDYDQGITRAAAVGGFLTNLAEFMRRGFLAKMPVQPPAVRLIMRDAVGKITVYHVGLDATPDEIRQPNQFTPWDVKHTPTEVNRRRSIAKIWEET